MPNKKILIIAGPNGAGKTTFIKEYLRNDANIEYFVNADTIALGLSQFSPEKVALKAGRLFLGQIDEYVSAGVNFSFETTLSSMNYKNKIFNWKNSGYQVKLIFLMLDNYDIAIRRVEQRVRQGGHFIAHDIIKRRFTRGLYNFHHVYKILVNSWQIYNNGTDPAILLDEGENA